MAIIYKVLRAAELAELLSNGETLGAPIDLTDGYIHMSTRAQVEETVAKHFVGEDGLKLLGVESDDLEADLKWEVSRGGALFPHLYRPLRLSDVEFTHDLPLIDGHHNFKGLLA